MSIEALKEQARNHEQNEQWGDALQLYVEAINRQSDEDQPDLGLYNRAGDLSTRLGDYEGAIQYYEQAVTLYLDAELPNNGIAILKKILRNVPGRHEVYLRMGQIRARQGFLTDARNNFLTYAELTQSAGDMDEAFRALEEFADLAPGDIEVRLALADQLHSHARTGECLTQLTRAHLALERRGDHDRADEIKQRIHGLDPEYVIVSASDSDGDYGAFETNVLADESEPEFGAAHEDDAFLDEAQLDDAQPAVTLEAELEVADEEVAFTEIALDDDSAADSTAVPSAESAAEDLLLAAEAGDGADEHSDAAHEPSGFEAAPVLDATEVDDDWAAWDGVGDDEDDLPEEVIAADGDGAGTHEDPAADGDDGSEDLPYLAALSADEDEDEFGWVAAALNTGAEAQELDAEGMIGEEESLAVLDEVEAPAADSQDDSGLLDFDDGSGADEASEVGDLPLLSFEAGDDAAEPQPEAEVAVALEEAEQDEDDDWQDAIIGAEPTASEDDDLWSELPEDELAIAAEVPAADAADSDDEWIGLDSAADEAADWLADEDVAPLPLLETAVEASESLPARADIDRVLPEVPALAASFEDHTLDDLRSLTVAGEAPPSAWERLGTLATMDGSPDEAQRAFEEAHLGYGESADFMSAMRCVRELLLVDPDHITYHQRLVEYAHRAGDRTLEVSAFLELADCLVRTGAPAKAQAVYQKVRDIDPANRRANAALSGGAEIPAAPSTDAPVEDENDYVDLGSMVIEPREKTTRWTVETEEPADEDDFDFREMLAQFKAKVADNLDAGDVKAHYDLGTAYKEMGLVDEAISEFQQALRGDGRNLATLEVLGQCFMEKGQPEVAVRSLTRAIEMPFDVEDELLGIYYYLGRAHEELGNRDEASEYYEKVFALDINFEDVTERLRALR